MKPKSTLRSFLAMAGSSLLTITCVSAGTYYWDSDGDGTAGFGSAAGTWSSATPTNANKWSTSPTGDGVGGAAVADYVTTTSDDLFFGTGPTGATPPLYSYTGITTISGTVNAKSIYQSANHPALAGSSPTINFGTVGIFESARAGGSSFPATTTLSGAATSLEWKMSYSQTLSLAAVSTNSVAGQNILTGPGRLAIATMAQLGTATQSLAFNGGVLRFTNVFPCDTYPSVTAFNAVHPISFTLNKDAGFDNQNSNVLRTNFTVDVPLALGTGGFSVEGNGAAVFILTNTGNNYTGATRLIGATLQISDAAHIGGPLAPFYFAGTLKITGNTMNTLGLRPVVIRGGSTMKLNIDDASNVFTVGQSLTDNDVALDGADGIPLGVPNDVAGTCGVTKSGAGTLVLSGTNSHTGLNTVSNNGGILQITNPSALGAGQVTISTNSTGTGTLDLALTGTNNITNTFNAFGAANSLTNVSPGNAHIRNTSGTNTITSNLASPGSGTAGINIVSNGDLLTLSGSTTFSATGTLSLGGSGNGVVSGAITSGANSVVKSGAGTWTLSNASNAYTGVTNIRGGTLIAGSNAPSGSAGAFGNATSEIGLGVAGGSDNAGILIGGAFTVGRNVRTATTDTTDAGTRVLTLGGNTADNSVFSGNIFLGTASQAGRGVTLTAASGGQVTFSGVIQEPGSMDATTYTVTKEGLGTVVLSNANTYTGATTVSAGTLTVNGSLADASMSIASGAVVNGTGTLTFNINGITADQVVNGGTINVAGLTVAVTETGVGLDQAEYVLVDATGGGSISGAFVGVTGATGYALDYGTPNQVKLVQAGDVIPPTLTSIADNVSGGPVTEDASVTYTVTFNEDIDDTTVTIGDFNNEGTAALTINSVVETGANTGIFTVVATPTSPGTLKLRIPTGAVVTDTAPTPNNLVVPVSDDTTITVKSKYEAWSGALDFDTDTNGDGIKNGLAFLLGAANKTDSALGLLPTVTQSGGDLILTFSMLNAANRKSASIQVQQSSDLGISDAWVDSAVVPEIGGPSPSVNGVTFNVTLGSPTNTVVATVAASEALPGTKLFGRLKANQ